MKYKYNDEWLTLKVPVSLPTTTVTTTVAIEAGELSGEDTIDMPAGYSYTNSRVIGYTFGISNRITSEDITVTSTQSDKLNIVITRASGDELGDVEYNVEIILMKLGTTESTLENYSTNEQLIGDWFGNPLYRKCYIVQAGNLVYNSWTRINTNSNFRIKKWSGWYYRSNNRADGFINCGDVDYDPLIVTIRNTDIEYRISTDYQQDGIEAVFIIEYTKSTD